MQVTVWKPGAVADEGVKRHSGVERPSCVARLVTRWAYDDEDGEPGVGVSDEANGVGVLELGSEERGDLTFLMPPPFWA